MGVLGGKYALVRLRVSYLEVDLGDIRPTDILFALIGRGGTLRLHVPSTKFAIHYLAGSQTLICQSKMGNGPLDRNQTTRANTDTMISPKTFYEQTPNQQISIREMGGGSV